MAEEKSRWDGFLGPKQWMPIVGILSVAVIALAIALVLNINKDDKSSESGTTNGGRTPVHEHADFLLMIRGQKFDFSQPQFLSTAGGKELSPYVHIHAPRYTVVHVHASLTRWDEFFTSLGFTLTDPSFPGVDSARTCMTLPDKTKLCNTDTEKWKFIVNGVLLDGISNVFIGDISRVLISYGPETADEVLKSQYPLVTDQACIPSELCLGRIDPNDPPEVCGQGLTCSK
mgnify:CR=1 FL=1